MGLALDLEAVVAKAAALYGDRLKRMAAQILDDLRPFLPDRIRFVLERAGYAYDEIEAALVAGSADLPDLRARVDARHRVRESADFLSVVLAAKRIANITKDAAEKPSPRRSSPSRPRDLWSAFAGLRSEVEEAAAAHDYERCLHRIAGLAPALEKFFVEVLVMAEDPNVRQNRIALLQAIGRTVNRTARITEVVVDKAEARAKAG